MNLNELNRKIKNDAVWQGLIQKMKKVDENNLAQMDEDQALQLEFEAHLKANYSKAEMMTRCFFFIKKYGYEKLYTKKTPPAIRREFHILDILLEQEFGVKSQAMYEEEMGHLMGKS